MKGPKIKNTIEDSTKYKQRITARVVHHLHRLRLHIDYLLVVEDEGDTITAVLKLDSTQVTLSQQHYLTNSKTTKVPSADENLKEVTCRATANAQHIAARNLTRLVAQLACSCRLNIRHCNGTGSSGHMATNPDRPAQRGPRT